MENSQRSTLDNVIGNIEMGVSTENSFNKFCEAMAFVSRAKPIFFTVALLDENWILAMHDDTAAFSILVNQNCQNALIKSYLSYKNVLNTLNTN